jgi:hypothetical protein
MSSMRFNASLDASHHGPPHPYKDAGVVADSLTGIHNAPVKCQQELHTQGVLVVPTGKNPEDSNLASMEGMQWVLLCLSIGHDRCYWEHLAQRGWNVPQHHHYIPEDRTLHNHRCENLNSYNNNPVIRSIFAKNVVIKLISILLKWVACDM